MNLAPSSLRKADSDVPVPVILAVIESVIKRAGQITEQAAAEHLDAFKQQMREKLGVDDMALDEPYLPALLKTYEAQFVESLEKLFDRVDRRMPETSAKSVGLPTPWLFEYKAIRFDAPLLPQIEERLNIETIRYTRHLKQGLDGARQQAAGIAKYVWRTMSDDRVRPSHAANAGKIFEWSIGESPGEAFGCRCSAEPILEDAGDPILQANPIAWAAAIAAAAAKIATILRRTGARRAERAAEELAKKPKPTPPKPPKTPPTGKNPPPGGRTNTEWKLGKHKSDAKWENQMRERGWTKEKITDTIKNGKEYKAPNDVRRNDPTATATRYEKDGKFVVRDDQTGEILQVGGEKFIPKDLP